MDSKVLAIIAVIGVVAIGAVAGVVLMNNDGGSKTTTTATADSYEIGLGAFEVINEYYSKLPLNKESRPAWDKGAVAKASLETVSCEEFDDPMITDDLAPLGKAFILAARK